MCSGLGKVGGGGRRRAGEGGGRGEETRSCLGVTSLIAYRQFSSLGLTTE